MITFFITLGIIGWIINIIFGIKTMMDGWKHRDKKTFDLGVSVTVIGLFFGLVVGWAILGAMTKTKYIDKHFDDDEPGRVTG
jgi:membrane-anchored glycerophosphoryl diester phosphodiesterase (GDPDase)